jgi:hypothetical protein
MLSKYSAELLARALAREDMVQQESIFKSEQIWNSVWVFAAPIGFEKRHFRRSEPDGWHSNQALIKMRGM